MNFREWPEALENGSIRSIVPARITTAKPSTRIWGGDSFRNLNSLNLVNGGDANFLILSLGSCQYKQN
ncbi:hypothetical protein D3C73_1390260 [compost metagenome]